MVEASALTLSRAGLELIMSFEGLRLKAYQDGAGVWTIGYGHTKGVSKGMVILPLQAELFLIEDAREAERAVRSLITHPLTQNQYDALVSFTFNVGANALKMSTLRKLLNAGKVQEAAEQFYKWNKIAQDGSLVESAGLSKRRALERQLFLTSPY